MKTATFVAWGIIFLAALAGFSAFLFVAPENTSSTAAFEFIMAVSLAVGVLQPGAAAMFLWGLAGFKKELHLAYGAICAALVLLGLAQVQAAFLTFFGLQSSFWVTSGLVVVPYVAPVLLMFYGTRRLARLFGFASKFTSFWLVVLLASSATILVLLAAQLTSRDVQFIASVGMATWTTLFTIASVVITLKTAKLAAKTYREALHFLTAANATVASAGVAYVASYILLGQNNVLLDYGAALLPHLLAGFLYIRAAYAFKLINQEPNAKKVNVAQNLSLVDVIVFEASLVSNQASIDRMLDTLRAVTATAGRESFSSDQAASLKNLYTSLEEFLVNNEPIRQFTMQTVRQKIANQFGITEQELAQVVEKGQ